MKGKFVLVPFPFTDLTASKLRPALVLYEGKGDVVVAFVSSRIPDEFLTSSIKIAEEHDEFAQTGLKSASVIRLDKVATIIKRTRCRRTWRSWSEIEERNQQKDFRDLPNLGSWRFNEALSRKI